MNEFGYSIQKDNTISYDLNDRSVAEFVLEHEPSLHKCIQCGSCSGTCTSAAFTNYDFRKMQLLMQRGENRQLQQALSQCMLCGKCQLVCPRGINTRNVIRQIRIALTKLN
jgi:heterodisulfide reductase subunit C